MPITVKHSGNAAPFAAGSFAGSAKRGIPQMAIPAWGAGERLSRRKRGRRREEMTEEERLLEGLTKGRASTFATRAGFQGPTPVGVYNPNTVAAKAGFSGPVNLDGTVNLMPQEIAKNVQSLTMKRGMRSGADSGASAVQSDGTPGKTWIDADGNTWTNDRYGVPKVALKNNSGVDIEQEKMDRQEFDYKNLRARQEFDYKQNAARVAAREKFDYENLHKNQEDLYDYDYTDQQRQRFDQLNQAADEVRNSGEFKSGSPEQMDALSQIEKIQDEIRPTRRLKEKKQDPLALAQSKIFTDPVSGNRGFIKANGDLEFIKQDPDPAVQQADKQKSEFVSLYEKIATEPFKETKMVDIAGKMKPTTVERPKTDEEIKAEVDRAIKIKQDAESYLNPDAAAPAGKVVAPNGNTSYVGDTGLAIQKTERLFNSLRGMDGRKLSPEAKAVLGLGEDSFYAAAQEKANARGISVNEYISIVMKGLTQ